jgi:hypothetical protein
MSYYRDIIEVRLYPESQICRKSKGYLLDMVCSDYKLIPTVLLVAPNSYCQPGEVSATGILGFAQLPCCNLRKLLVRFPLSNRG